MENLGKEEDMFWARGFTEDLIVKIASAGNLKVAPIKEILNVDTKKDLKEIAQKLGVKHILTSSMHKKHADFDLRCQLIDISSGISNYGKKWTEKTENASKIVDRLSEDILKRLNVKSKNSVILPAVSPEILELYYKARDLLYEKKNFDSILNARKLLEKILNKKK